MKLSKKYKPQRLDKVLSKYSKYSKSVGEIEYYYDKTVKYLKSEPVKTIPEIVELNPWNKIGKGLKFLTPNNLLTGISVFLAQMKARNNSDRCYIFYINTNTYIVTTVHTNPTPVAFKNCTPFIHGTTKLMEQQ